MMRLQQRLIGLAFGGAAAAFMQVGVAAAQDRVQSAVLAQQGQPNPFSALVGEKRERRADRPGGKVERFVLASDNRAFLIQSRTRTARMKFLCGADDPRLDCTLDAETPAPEIILVTATRGPRGDSIYKNADGETLLRLASYGGATVQWPGDTAGSAASKSFGDDHTIELPTVGYDTALRRANAATAVISAATGSPITFDAPAPSENGSVNASVLADAIMRAANGVHAVAGDPTGARILVDRIRRVAFEVGPAPTARFEGDALIIQYVPDQDISGRLSSRAVERFLEEYL